MKEDNIGPVFIVGNSRSGTTLMSRILKLHSKVYVLNETFMFDEVSKYESTFNVLNDAEIEAIIRDLITIQRKGIYLKSKTERYLEDTNEIMRIYKSTGIYSLIGLLSAFYKYEANKNGKVIYGDQTPRHVFSIEWIIRLFPNCKIINMVRDPRAVLLSQRNKWKACKKYQQPIHEVIRAKINYHPFTISLLWNKSVDAAFSANKNKLYSPHIKTVIFEELVEDSSAIVKSVCDFAGIEFEKNMLNVDVEMTSNLKNDGQKGVVSDIANTWKNRLSNSEVYICEKTVGLRLEHYGYKRLGNDFPDYGLIGWLLFWPPHIMIAILLNVSRMGGNPLNFFLTRLRANK